MLAKKVLEPRYLEWNRRWGAPYGREGRILDPRGLQGTPDSGLSGEIARQGVFCLQPNNDTRVFEYPWAWHAAELRGSMRVLEIGGGLSGFPFALSREGHRVENVDPGVGWFVSPGATAALNRVFATDVTLHHCRIEDATLEPGAYDRVFSLSVLEHLHPDAAAAAMAKAAHALAPGGLAVLTVDLFLDLVPFSRKVENHWGRNVSIESLIDPRRFEMVRGLEAELYGFPGFDAREVLANLPDYYLGGGYPTLIQTIVLRRR